MLCGRYCLEAASDVYSDSPSELSPFLGSVSRHQQPERVYWKPERRSFSSLPIRLKVCLSPFPVYFVINLTNICEISSCSRCLYSI